MLYNGFDIKTNIMKNWDQALYEKYNIQIVNILNINERIKQL